jgi:hypothetical protein
MIVHVREDSSITLDEPDVFTAFSVRAPRHSPEGLLAAFGADARAGEAASGEAGHLWIAIERLHALGAIHGAADWREGCDAMIEYARGKGWIDASGRFVRAHVES